MSTSENVVYKLIKISNACWAWLNVEVKESTVFIMMSYRKSPGSLSNATASTTPGHSAGSNVFRRTLKADGRIEFFYSAIARNLHRPTVEWLVFLLELYAHVTKQGLLDAALRVKIVATEFLKAACENKTGHRIRVTFDVYGNSEEAVWKALDEVFEGLEEVFRRVERAQHVALPEFP